MNVRRIERQIKRELAHEAERHAEAKRANHLHRDAQIQRRAMSNLRIAALKAGDLDMFEKIDDARRAYAKREGRFNVRITECINQATEAGARASRLSRVIYEAAGSRSPRTAPAVRFWTWWQGAYARVTVIEGVPVRLYHWHAHDEGWSSFGQTFWLEGGQVTCRSESDGRDCDGRLSSGSDTECPVHRLQDEAREGTDGVPDWRPIDRSSWQRDEYAEAAGY